MKTFSEFLLTEQAANLHMMHLEDQVIYGGVEGTRQAIFALRNMRDLLAGNSRGSMNVTVKYDGAPAVFCGYVPKGEQNEGKFFVAKKGLFNKDPKYYTSDAEINADTSGDLAAKLRACLKELPKVFKNTSDVFQGDLMFTSSDVKSESIDGEKYFVFQPNTIAYAVPVDSNAGREVKSAKIGIVFHTRYRGKSFAEMKASFDVNADKDFSQSKDVWLQDANLSDKSGTVTLTDSETAEVTQAIADAGRIFQKISGSTYRQLQSNQELARMIETYNNTFVRANQPIGDTRSHTQNLIKWISDKFQAEIDKRKTEKGKLAQRAKLDELLEFFSDNNKENLQMIFDLQKAIVVAKLLIINKLNVLNRTKTFLKTANGYRATDQEGYVAIDRMSNGALKLVDRLEFSYANFSPDVIKGWEKV